MALTKEVKQELIGKHGRNEADWEGRVVEGPFVIFHDGWYYLFYAGSACCGLECSYAEGVARAGKAARV